MKYIAPINFISLIIGASLLTVSSAEELPKSVTIKEDARLAIQVSLPQEEKTASEWSDILKKATHLQLDLPEASKGEKIYLLIEKQPLRQTLNAIGYALNLGWKLSKDSIIFMPEQTSLLEEVTSTWDQETKDMLDLPDEERLRQQFTLSGEVLDHLTPEDLSALQTGAPINIDRLSLGVRERLTKVWLLKDVIQPKINPLLDPKLYIYGQLTAKASHGEFGLSISTGQNGTTTFGLAPPIVKLLPVVPAEEKPFYFNP